MSQDSQRLRDVLSQIAELASSVAPNGSAGKKGKGGSGNGKEVPAANYGCAIKSVPTRLLMKSAETALKVSPYNAFVPGPMARVPGLAEAVTNPLAATLLVTKYWGPTPRRLTVSFMDNPSRELRNRILSHLNAWTRTGGIRFAETQGVGQVRISRGPGGFFSYLGTDILLIPQNLQTMNLQGFTMNTPDREFFRVIRHEAGHTLGFPHEHMRRELVARIDPQRAYPYFLRTQGWDKPMVNQQVLTPLDQNSIFGTPADEDSIMCYFLPGEITRDGRPILGGDDINQTDFQFCGQIYPRFGASGQAPAAVDPAAYADDEGDEPTPLDAYEEVDWPESEDVEVAVPML